MIVIFLFILRTNTTLPGDLNPWRMNFFNFVTFVNLHDIWSIWIRLFIVTISSGIIITFFMIYIFFPFNWHFSSKFRDIISRHVIKYVKLIFISLPSFHPFSRSRSAWKWPLTSKKKIRCHFYVIDLVINSLKRKP